MDPFYHIIIFCVLFWFFFAWYAGCIQLPISLVSYKNASQNNKNMNQSNI